jgi:hypothetical protein
MVKGKKQMSIKVIEYDGSPIKTEFAGNGIYRLASQVNCRVETNEGALHYFMFPGFPTDMRSGSHVIDFIIPKFTSNNNYNLAILCHDFAYTRNKDGGHYISRLLSDQLLREMTKLSGTLNAVQRSLMYNAVRLFGSSAYESQNTGAWTDAQKFMSFRWKVK